MANELNLVEIKNEINSKLGDAETFKALVSTTFKGLADTQVKKAILEGYMRGFTFENFLKKDVYAIPFKDGYTLITSIDYARKVGMRNGIVGKKTPVYVLTADKKIESCEVTVLKRFDDGYVGEFTALVFFDEYYKEPIKKGTYEIKSLWDTKPRTMIAKVAEMHAIRMACPEDTSNMYIEEEFDRETQDTQLILDTIPQDVIEKVENAQTVEELTAIYNQHEGLGKEFAQLIIDKKTKLSTDNKKENADS